VQTWVTDTLNAIVTWYKDNQKAARTTYYAGKDSIGAYYKHLSQHLETYIELVQSKKLDAGLTDIEPLLGDLLAVLVEEQSSDSYESRFLDVWVRIFNTIVFLVSQGLSQALCQRFAESFMRLAPLYQEAIYPDLHLHVQTMGKGPEVVIKFIKAFLALQTPENVRRVY